MDYRKVRRLPVVDDAQLVGMLAQADVVHEVKEKKAARDRGDLPAVSSPPAAAPSARADV